MEFHVQSGDLAQQVTPCLVLGVFEERTLSAPGQAVDAASGGRLSAILARGDLDGATGRTLMLYDVPGIASERVLLVGCGKPDDFKRGAFAQAVAAAASLLQDAGTTAALLTFPEVRPAGIDLYTAARDTLVLALDKVYRYALTKEDKKPVKQPLTALTLWVANPDEVVVAERAARHGAAIARGMTTAKDLGNLPGNICTPTYLAERALALAEGSPEVQVTILEAADMAELKMGALLSVARGSRQPPKLIVVHYRGGLPAAKPVVLVGKGLTFDAGGISIKPAEAMDEMKYDMCGGAAVLGTLQAVAELKLPINLIGVVPASENLPDGDANKPGDIVTSMSGQTIEVLNTDAEGRLILCDALTYCERFEPALVVDVATLTGACIVALGKHAAGLFTADESLAAELIAAGSESHDRVWRLPLWDDYQQQLDSNFADMANIGGREAGSVTAACFLARYTKAYPWAHLDIAGIAWLSGKEKGATGRPVALLTHFLLRRAGQM